MIKTKDGDVIAYNVEYCKGFIEKRRGLILRFSPPDALILEFEKQKQINIHTFLVFFDLKVIFLDSKDKINKIEELKALKDRTKGEAKRIVEIPNCTETKLEKGQELIILNS